MSDKSTITINGMVFEGTEIKIKDGAVHIDNVVAPNVAIDDGKLEIKVEGSLASLTCDGNVVVQGAVKGSISAGNNVSCECVGGSVSAGNNVKCGRVGGPVSAGGNVRHA